MAYHGLRQLLFQMDAERAHHFVLNTLKYIPQSFFKSVQGHEVSALGHRFNHAVGLAAGLDKNGTYIDALAKLGFSFIEVGTVTPKPQSGNPKPRLFRLEKAQAIINRMGFNNQGVEALVKNIKRARYKGILGVNIGKNRQTSLNKAADDYVYCLQKVYDYASYVTINISSPNTPDLRQLQHGQFYQDLLTRLREEQIYLSELYQRYVPLVVKLSPDEDKEALKYMTDVILQHGIEGIIATNTTSDHTTVAHLKFGQEEGGLSGQPLAERSTQTLKILKSMVGDAVTLIAAGGIDSPAVAKEKIAAGASLLQIYTGLIYQGPSLIKKLAENEGKGRH